VDKWSCLRVIIDFVFDQQQPKLGRDYFCKDAIRCGQTISIGVCAMKFAGVG